MSVSLIRYKDIPVAGQSIRIRCNFKPSSEFNQLLQFSIVIKYEYNNASRHNGLELIRIRFYGWCWWTMSLYYTNQSIHVSSSYNSRTGNCYEFKHRHIEIESETAFIRLFQSLLNPVIIYIASLSLQLWWTFGLSVCRRNGFCLRQRSRGHVINSDVLTQSSLK